MKFLIMFGSLTIAILFGLFPSLFKPKPFWWKMMAILLVCASLVLTLLPTTAGNLSVVKFLKDGLYHELDLKVKVINSESKFDAITKTWTLKLDKDRPNQDSTFIYKGETLPAELTSNHDQLVLRFIYDKQLATLVYNSTISIDPLITYPFVPTLDERIKILNLHVPQAWIAVIAFLFSMIYAVQYLRTQNMDYDLYTSSAASLGTLFAILATVTGMLWAKYNWGTYWNWDPRQTSIFVLILIYLAYFALRSSIDNEERKARFSAVYSIIAFVTVPFLVFVLPRLSTGLHPGSSGDTNAGPVVSTKTNALDSNMVWGFGLGLIAFTIIFFWLLNISIRQNKLKNKLQMLNN